MEMINKSYRRMYEALLCAQLKAIEVLQEGQQFAKQAEIEGKSLAAMIMEYDKQPSWDEYEAEDENKYEYKEEKES